MYQARGVGAGTIMPRDREAQPRRPSDDELGELAQQMTYGELQALEAALAPYDGEPASALEAGELPRCAVCRKPIQTNSMTALRGSEVCHYACLAN